MRKLKWLVGLFAAGMLAGSALGQGVRFDSSITTAAKNVAPGTQAPIYSMPGSLVTVCGYPATPSGAVCTNMVTVYSDKALTLTVAQPISADATGAFGFWLPAGTYSYSVQNAAGAYLGTYSLTLAPANAVQTSPTASQTITQPAGTTLRVNSLNNVYYVNQASDLVTQVNSFLAGCDGSPCVVHVPMGSYTTAGTIFLTSPSQSIVGDGPNKTYITYSGAGPFLDLHMGSNFSASGSNEVSGFTLTMSNSAALGISAGSGIGYRFSRLNLIGPAGQTCQSGSVGTSEAFKFQSPSNWMERWRMEDVQVGGFQHDLHFYAPTGSGTNSFAYGSVTGLQVNTCTGGNATQVDSGANAYHLLRWDMSFNLQGTSSGDAVFTVGGIFRGNNFNVTGENASANYTFIHVLSTGAMQWHGGQLNLFGPPSTGGTTVDAGGQYEITPVQAVGDQTTPVGTISNFGGSGQTASVYPIEDFRAYDPGQTAQRTYITAGGYSAPFDIFDPRTVRCHGTLQGGSTGQLASAAVPVWCTDGSGQFTRPSWDLPGFHSVTGGNFDIAAYVNNVAPSNRRQGNGSLVVEDNSAVVSTTSGPCLPFASPVTADRNGERARICMTPLNTSAFDLSGVLHLQVAKSGSASWIDVFNASYIGGTFTVPIALPAGSAMGGSGLCTLGNGACNALTASLTTTAATSDVVTVTGMTASGHCSLTATNASAATNLTTTYISAKATNSVTVTHTATVGMTYDLICTPY